MRGILSADQTVDKLTNTDRQPHNTIYNSDAPLQDFQINSFWIFHPFTLPILFLFLCFNSIHKNTREQEDIDNT